MPRSFSTTELEAYLDEDLSSEVMAEIEQALRQQKDLAGQLSNINARRDAGMHSLGEIWRRFRLTCPSRRQLGNYLLGVLSEDEASYVKFHLEDVACRQCTANLADLNSQQLEAAQHAASRRRKYFQSSAGFLRSGSGD